MSTVPGILAPRLDAIPSTLTSLDGHWGVWAAKWRPERGKFDKQPRDPRTHLLVSTKKHWWTFDVARAAYESDPDLLAGVGLSLTHLKGFVGIDLDRCVDEHGTIAPWACEVIESADSYAELSPSGRGIRIFVKGDIERDWQHRARGIELEVYGGHSARYLTITGHHVEGTPRDVR